MRTTAPGLGMLVEGAGAAYEEAAAAAGEHVIDCAPGGVPVRIRMAGALHAAFAPALPAHAPGPAPAVELRAWAGGAMPPAPWALDDLLPSAEIRGFEHGSVLAAIGSNCAISLYDRAARRGVFWTREAATLGWELGAPLRNLLGWALADRGLELVHGAAVARPGGGDGVLLLGTGGAGKSTTALACLDAGLDVVADDYVLLDGGLRAHRLYVIAKADERTLELLPGLQPLAGPVLASEDKAHLDLRGRYAESVGVRALVLPRVGAETGSPVPITAGAVFKRVIASSLQQAPGRRAGTVAAMAALVRRLPAYELPVGPDPAAVVARVEELCS